VLGYTRANVVTYLVLAPPIVIAFDEVIYFELFFLLTDRIERKLSSEYTQRYHSEIRLDSVRI